MKLHCCICALVEAGTDRMHMGQHSEVGAIEMDKIRLPLTPDMFSSPNPARGVPHPFPRGFDHASMFHVACGRLPWGLSVADGTVQRAVTDGGPRKLLTDEGWLYISEDGIDRVVPFEGSKTQAQKNQAEIEGRWLDPDGDETEEAAASVAEKVSGEAALQAILDGGTPYVCPVCGKEYKRSDHFSAHFAGCKG